MPISAQTPGDSRTQSESPSSWNPHVSCTPALTSFEEIVSTPSNNHLGGILANSNWATYDFGYVDSNNDNVYEIGEPVVWDINQNGIVDLQNGTNDQSYAIGGQYGGDRVISSYPPPLVPTSLLGAALKNDSRIRYIDGTVTAYYNTTNGSYDLGGRNLGETIVFDANDNKQVDTRDVIINGTARAPKSIEIGKPLETVTMGGTWNKRNLNPACTVTNKSGQIVSTFVEIHGVHPVYWAYTGDCLTMYNWANGGGTYPNGTSLCDATGNWQTLGTTGSCTSSVFTACSHRLHFEIDRDWMAKGWCGPTSVACNNSTLAQAQYVAGDVSLDIQGFVYWDPTEAGPGHNYSGWEIHPFTAWRLSPIQHSTSTLVECDSPVAVDQASNCTASVSDTASSGQTTPTGTVDFSPGETCTLASGSCSVTITPTATGTLAISASYEGDSVHDTSTGSTSVVVSLRITTTAVSCPDTGTISIPLMCTTTVVDTAPGTTTTPTGTVTFVQGTCTLVGGSCSVSITPLATPSLSVFAIYGGDPTHGTSSDSTSVAVTKRGTSITEACESLIVVNQAASCTITITDSSPGVFITPTGPVLMATNSTGTFDGSCNLSGYGASATCEVAYVPRVALGHRITAYYAGDTAHNANSGLVDISVVPNRPPVASFSQSKISATVGDSILFDGSNSSDPDGTINLYQWDFGDGSPTSSGINVAHSYSKPGSYTVRLTVTDDNGNTASSVMTITIRSGFDPAPFYESAAALSIALVAAGVAVYWRKGRTRGGTGCA